MAAQLGSTLKKMVITDDCYESGKLWGNALIGVFGTEGLVAVGKGTIKLGKLASMNAKRVAKIEKLSEAEAGKIIAKASGEIFNIEQRSLQHMF